MPWLLTEGDVGKARFSIHVTEFALYIYLFGLDMILFKGKYSRYIKRAIINKYKTYEIVGNSLPDKMT